MLGYYNVLIVLLLIGWVDDVTVEALVKHLRDNKYGYNVTDSWLVHRVIYLNNVK